MAHHVIQGAHILCTPVLDTEGVMSDQHNLARGAFQDVEQPGAGKLTVPKAPFRFSEAEVDVPGPAPRLGEHNAQVLVEVLGYSTEKIEQLTKEGVLFSPPTSPSAVRPS
jgi:crotonobetainyl-CoA:carnitine CoA-transferase CaiB-like acyl-CoA transferase